MDTTPTELAELLAYVKDLEARIVELEKWRGRADLLPREQPAPLGTIPFPRAKGRKRL